MAPWLREWPGEATDLMLDGAGVLADAFRNAGFIQVTSRVVAAPVRLPSAAECVRFEQGSCGAVHQMLSTLDADGKAATWDEISSRLARFEHRGRFAGPCELILGVGTRE